MKFLTTLASVCGLAISAPLIVALCLLLAPVAVAMMILLTIVVSVLIAGVVGAGIFILGHFLIFIGTLL